jgi:hypothetical protein
MRCKPLLECVITISLLSAALPASAQAVYSALEMRPRLSAGAGFSGFSQDWGHNPAVYGTTLWVEYHPPVFPDFLSGLSLEIQARDLSWNRGKYPATNPTVPNKPILPRTDTIGGGLIYHIRPQGYYKFEPYVKALGSFGSIDFTLPAAPDYSHSTHTVTSLGGGLDWHARRHVTVRGDLEYQFWPGFLGATLNPVGFTGGVLYNFSFRH